MTSPDKQFLLEEYKSRINRVFDYIEQNISKRFSLDELASVSNFSKFHFHRIFHGMTGETPFQFILRVRLERAATYLAANPKKTISEIADECGFSDQATFAKSFRNHFKMSATDWRKNKSIYQSNLGKTFNNFNQTIGNKTQSEFQPSMYYCNQSKTIKWRTTMELNKSTEVKELPEMTVAYVRHIGPYKGDSKLFEKLFNKLFTWAGPRGLAQQQNMKSIIVYHDDPEVTEAEKLRTSVSITVPEDTKVDGEIGKMVIPGGKYMIARFDLTTKNFQAAWDWVYGKWLPTSGYQPDDRPCFEMYGEECTKEKFIVDICVPVKPL
ncbi:MAG: AraC family transcriptional regulator [Bacteroidales bacterium]|nr:MAG: AraC family transcriptional regulator [Bacteroidales bacterium]